ncbi:MAG TPA: hypothetical protein VEC14_10840 [Reyranellaceae bacterium]|nr:hypothetical protein [Reyranellaceae bacterium]
MSHDVDALLRREGRAGLPLARQLLIYLNPFALFKDASRGNALMRQAALSYNRAMRWMLVTYLWRWMLIAGASYCALFVVPGAVVGVAFCVAVAVMAATAAAWLLLGVSRSPH